MSLLSSLFCCFSGNDRTEDDTRNRQRLSPAQTNLQKALSNKPRLATTNSKMANQVPKMKTSPSSTPPESPTLTLLSSPSVQQMDDQDAKTEIENVSIQTDTTDTMDLTKMLPDQAVAESGWLLNPQPEHLKGRKCLVLDLDETLVHSSFKYVRNSDFVIPVDIDNQIHNVYVIKRPGVDEFLRRCGELFEVVVFTASVSRYGDPLLDILDKDKTIHHRLFRDSCYNYDGNYIKNLSQMGRPLSDLIIIDNSPASYIFHPQHAVPVSSWFSDTHDCELADLLPFLEDLATQNVDDVSLVLDVNI